MDITVTVKRYNPEKDDSPYKEKYNISLDDRNRFTILDILYMIKEKEDGSLAFRCSCRSGICGSCAVRVNGHETLACTSDVTEVSRRYGSIVIEPLKNLKVIKDLVVDLRPMWDRLLKLPPWLIGESVSELGRAEDRKTGSLPSSSLPLFRAPHNIASSCILCGACYSDCEAFKVDQNFLGPAVFNKGYRFVIDPRDKDRKNRLKRLAESGLWHCSHCYLCSFICPKGINPKDSISCLRIQAYKIGINNNPGARYIDGFYQGIKRSGRISEALLAMKVKGAGLIKEIPFFLKVLIRKKVPVLRAPIKGKGEIRRIYEIIERGRGGCK